MTGVASVPSCSLNRPGLVREQAYVGGLEESGIGGEGSKYGIEEWLEIKYVALAGLESARAKH